MAADMCFPPKLVKFSLVPLLTLCFAGNLIILHLRRQNSMLGLEAVSLVSDIWAGLLRISESNLPGTDRCATVSLRCINPEGWSAPTHKLHVILGDLTRNHHIMEAQNEFYSVHPHIPAVLPWIFSDY